MSPTKLDLSQIQFPDSMGIRDAALYTGMSEQYIRTMVRQTTLKASKNEAGEWEILKSTLDELMAQPRQRGGGTRAGGKAFVINVKPDDQPAVESALAAFGITLKPRYTYKPKSKGAKVNADVEEDDGLSA